MTHAQFNTAEIRAQFPALSITDNGAPRVYLDNPAGTQMPRSVIDAMVAAMTTANANLGGYFTTSRAAEDLVDAAHEKAALFYNAGSVREIIFGANMTTLTLHMSRCLAKDFREGDEIILSRMDHDANIAPWLLIAEDIGMTVRWLEFDADACEFAEDAIDPLLNKKTRLVAIGYASNCTGTVHDVKSICEKARSAGALTYVDAVQFAPHRLIDVQDLGCDFLVSSAYKFFGPHVGILWGREEILERTFAYQVRPPLGSLPGKFETGTTPRELLAGAMAAMDYFEAIGVTRGAVPGRAALAKGFELLDAHETGLTRRLIDGLRAIKGVTIHGLTSANAMHRRVPTVSLTCESRTPEELARACAAENIFVWDGHNYAVEPVRHLGLMDTGGVLRIGLAHYNTEEEVDKVLGCLERVV